MKSTVLEYHNRRCTNQVVLVTLQQEIVIKTILNLLSNIDPCKRVIKLNYIKVNAHSFILSDIGCTTSIERSKTDTK